MTHCYKLEIMLCDFTRSDFITPADNFFGAPSENGSWNGMIGMLHRGEADFAVEKFVMSPARLQAVDFISTLEQVKYESVVFQRVVMYISDFCHTLVTTVLYQ